MAAVNQVDEVAVDIARQSGRISAFKFLELGGVIKGDPAGGRDASSFE